MTFMDAGANDPLRKLFAQTYSKTLYDDEFSRVQRLGFNTLGGWSNIEFLADRAPYGIVLFDDPDHPLKWPLRDAKGNPPPLADSEVPCPIGDPYDPDYISALNAYLDRYVTKQKSDIRLLMYWIGAEFGLGDTNAIDFSQYIFSQGVRVKFSEWLTKKYLKVDNLNKRWTTNFISFIEASTIQSTKSEPYKADALEFSNQVVQDWFHLVVDGIRKRDPNHLIGSPKISAWDFKPFLDEPIRLGHFKTFQGLFDVFSVDWYSGKPIHDAYGKQQLLSLSRELGIPIIIGEWGIRQRRDGWTNTPGAKSFVENQTERAKNYASQILNVFKHPEFIGAHWFRWQDHLVDKHQFNKGIIKIEKNKIAEYDELTSAMRAAHIEIELEVKKILSR